MAAEASLSFSVGFVAALTHGVGHAVGEVVVEQLQGHRLEGLGRRGHLLQDVDAVPVLVHHALQAPDLALHPAQALLHGVLVVDVARSHGPPIVGTQYPYRVSCRAGAHALGQVCAPDWSVPALSGLVRSAQPPRIPSPSSRMPLARASAKCSSHSRISSLPVSSAQRRGMAGNE